MTSRIEGGPGSNEGTYFHWRNRKMSLIVHSKLYRMSRMGEVVPEVWGVICYNGEIDTGVPPGLEVPSIWRDGEVGWGAQ